METQTHAVLVVRPHKAGTNTFKQLAMLCLVHPGIQLPLLAARARYWLALNLGSTKIPRFLSTEDSPVSCPPAYTYLEDYSVLSASSGICCFLKKILLSELTWPSRLVQIKISSCWSKAHTEQWCGHIQISYFFRPSNPSVLHTRASCDQLLTQNLNKAQHLAPEPVVRSLPTLPFCPPCFLQNVLISE